MGIKPQSHGPYEDLRHFSHTLSFVWLAKKSQIYAEGQLGSNRMMLKQRGDISADDRILITVLVKWIKVLKRIIAMIDVCTSVSCSAPAPLSLLHTKYTNKTQETWPHPLTSQTPVPLLVIFLFCATFNLGEIFLLTPIKIIVSTLHHYSLFIYSSSFFFFIV